MVSFRRYTLVCLLLVLLADVAGLLVDGSPFILVSHHFVAFNLLAAVVWFTFPVILSFLPCTGFHYPVRCSGETSTRVVSLTFDDGPDAARTPLILDVLKKRQVQATFFCTGSRIAKNVSIANRIHGEGHLIGNHSWSHSSWFDLFSARRIREELVQTDQVISAATGKVPLFFRPPYGVVNPLVAGALNGRHWKVVCWNVRSLDTVIRDPELIRRRILRKLRPGAIILVHDAGRLSPGDLDILIGKISESGYGFIPLDKMLNLPAYV